MSPAMQNAAQIGPSIVINGHISAGEPLSIAGCVNGTVTVAGHVVTVEPGARVEGDIAAAGIVVAGSITGALAADERIQLRASAEVEGDMAAPKILFEDGALACGRVDVTGQQRATLVA